MGPMNDQQLDDLKQFIDARLSQSEQSIKDELKAEIEQLRTEVHDGFSGVGEAVEQANQVADEKYDELRERLTKLEHQAAA